MRSAERPAVRFVRMLVSGAEARPDGGGRFRVGGAGGTRLSDGEVRALVSAGLLTQQGNGLRATPEARMWLRRQLVESDAFSAQHRLEGRRADGTLFNVAESPLGRLASTANGQPAFLRSHQVEAGERVRRLAERAQLQPRVTMSYTAAFVAGGTARAADIGDLAADARRALAEVYQVLPADCAGVVMDVCGLLKGLQTVETERGWPRRSAKLVLRIGLEQLAQHYGLAPVAVGTESRRSHAWLGTGAKPTVFG